MTLLPLKQFILVAVLWPAFVLGWAGLALAELKDFGTYTMKIPPTWKTSYIDNVMVLTSPDREAIFLITRGISQAPHEKIIEKLKKRIRVKSLDNQKHLITITALRWERVVVTIMGDHPDRVTIYRSIKAKPQEIDLHW